MRHARSSLRHAGSFVVARGLFVAVPGFCLVVACGFSLSSCDARAPGCMGSAVVERRLQSTWALYFAACRLSSCGAGAQ